MAGPIVADNKLLCPTCKGDTLHVVGVRQERYGLVLIRFYCKPCNVGFCLEVMDSGSPEIMPGVQMNVVAD